MAILIKSDKLEIYCEDFNINNGILNVAQFVGVGKQNIGEGLHLLIDSSVEINYTDTLFSQIKEEAWENIQNNFTSLNTRTNDDVYKNEGMAIFVKGKMVIGIYPDNLKNNLELLAKGQMKFDWEFIKNNI